MPAHFETYRILCCTPPDLESERLLFEDANAQFSEEVAVPNRVLFAVGSLRPPINPVRAKDAIETNIRECDFVIHIFGEREPEPVFRGFADLTLQCEADSSLPLRASAFVFRNPSGMADLRQSLLASGQTTVRDYQNADDLAPILREILEAWYASVKG